MIVDSFCGAGARGNRHHIVALDTSTLDTGKNIEAQIWQQALKPHANTLVLWQQNDCWHARFFDSGHPVLRCGSGNIAVAAYLYTHEFHNTFNLTLHTAAGAVTVGVDNKGAYYCDRPCPVSAKDDPARWTHLCQTPVSTAVRMGGRQDYTLLLLPDPHALSQLRLRARALKLYSARSVIALAPAHRYWHLRYFAPQYGVPEDAATGSACVQASNYLARITHHRRFSFNQRSRARGIIHTEKRPHEVIVRGSYRLY
jgi:predicted PhzF superfamily epimerase YddE/YHI9